MKIEIENCGKRYIVRSSEHDDYPYPHKGSTKIAESDKALFELIEKLFSSDDSVRTGRANDK